MRPGRLPQWPCGASSSLGATVWDSVQQPIGVDPHQLNRRWRPALIAFFMRRVGNHAEAEDLTQEVFLRMLNAKPASNPEAFIFEIARNLITDRARKLKVRERHRELVSVDNDRGIDFIDPHSVAVGRERVAVFAKALQDLPERTRAFYVLYRFENISQDVIAESFGISSSAVKQQIAKATAYIMKKLREAE